MNCIRLLSFHHSGPCMCLIKGTQAFRLFMVGSTEVVKNSHFRWEEMQYFTSCSCWNAFLPAFALLSISENGLPHLLFNALANCMGDNYQPNRLGPEQKMELL